MPTLLTVSLRDMRFHVRVGILPHERELPQPLEIDLTVTVDPGSVVDYRDLHAVAQTVVAADPLDYLEAIAEAIGAGAAALPGVHGVRVAIRKPHVALPGPLGAAEIVLVRGRSAVPGTAS